MSVLLRRGVDYEQNVTQLKFENDGISLMAAGILDIAYPVGMIVITDGTTPEDLGLPGTWTEI